MFGLTWLTHCLTLSRAKGCASWGCAIVGMACILAFWGAVAFAPYWTADVARGIVFWFAVYVLGQGGQ